MQEGLYGLTQKGEMTLKIAAFGEIVWDVYPDNACLGGAPLNFAAHLARHGHEVYMLSAVGEDDYGEQALLQLQDLGVHTEYIARLKDKQTGKCLVSLNEAGVPMYDLLQDTAYDHIPTASVGADVLYFGTLALRSEHNRHTLRQLLDSDRFADVFVDVNIRAPFYSEETIRFAVEQATILKISDEELPTVAKALHTQATDQKRFMQTLMQAYPRLQCLILTRGAEGSYVLHRDDNAVCSCAGKAVEVVSTVGAGDSFSAAFLHMYSKHEPMERCAAYASTVAGFVVSRQEAVPPYDPQCFVTV
ncbi:MAG: carbohydrate kinase [Ruminococcaceae bacterium]|nr:carbohydrate kinase [Oscillospiraceae bacterium]